MVWGLFSRKWARVEKPLQFLSQNMVPVKTLALKTLLYSKARNSMGAKLEAADEVLLKGFAESVCSLYERKRQIETYIQDSMESDCTQSEPYCRPDARGKINKPCRKSRETCCFSFQHHSGYRGQQGSFQTSSGSGSISEARDYLQPPSYKYRSMVDKGKNRKSPCSKTFSCCTH